MNAFSQGLLFWSSYTPLLVVFALLDTFGAGVPTLVCLCLAVGGLLATSVLFIASRGAASSQFRVQTVGSRSGDVLAYIATYLVPFAATTAQTGRQQAALGVFIGLIAILFIRLELFYVNPLLALLGLRAFEVVSSGGSTVVLLSRERFIAPGSVVKATRLSESVWRQSK